MIRTLEFSSEDQKHLSRFPAQMRIMPPDDNLTDYSRVVVNKPWGYEYLAFKNGDICVWILYIKHGYQTSTHCHPNKYTSLVLLSGQAIFETLNSRVALTVPDAIEINKKVFHSTRALSDPGILVMETESPTNKKDLLRLQDKYGREGLGYEGREHTIPRTPDLHYSFHDELSDYYDVERAFGECALTIKKFRTGEELKTYLSNSEVEVICVLKGSILDENHKSVAGAGKTCHVDNLVDWDKIKFSEAVELLFIKKNK